MLPLYYIYINSRKLETTFADRDIDPDLLAWSVGKIDGVKVAMLQLLPWAIGRRSGNDVVRITNAIVPGCLLPVCFPLCSYTLTMLHHDTSLPHPQPARLHILPSAFVSRQFAIAGLGFNQLSARFYIKQSGMRT